MAHGEAREWKWRGNRRMKWVASTLHTTSVHGVSSITTADAQTSAASSRLNWRPCLFKWARLFPRKTKSSFCACAITFQTQSTNHQVFIVFCKATYHLPLVGVSGCAVKVRFFHLPLSRSSVLCRKAIRHLFHFKVSGHAVMTRLYHHSPGFHRVL